MIQKKDTEKKLTKLKHRETGRLKINEQSFKNFWDSIRQGCGRGRKDNGLKISKLDTTINL